MGSRDSAPDSGRVHSSVRPPLTARPRRYPVSAGEPLGTIPPGRNSPESQGTIPPSPNSSIAPTPSGRPPKLLDRLSGALRARGWRKRYNPGYAVPRHYSPRTEQTYCHWVKRFIFFHHAARGGEAAACRSPGEREAHTTRDVADGYGRVALPDALARKYPKAAWEWRWQHLFPQEHRWVNARTGEQGRYHMDESLVYTHVLNRGGRGVRSPVDSLVAPPATGVIDGNQITPQ